ncbi:MAG: serine/threonine-protein phosphatase [Leptospirales bacterium]|nr:serine/threonine-protein phosphatase [Leptospirales bacterium]
MEPVLLASYGYAWASGAAFLIGLFAAFMSTGRSENELWRRFSLLSFVNTAFCLVSVWQNQTTVENIYVANRWNLGLGMLLGPAFLDFVLCFANYRNNNVTSLGWAAAFVWLAILALQPEWLLTRELSFVEMPLHYYKYTSVYFLFQATLFGMITFALITLYVQGRNMPERTGLMRRVLPGCVLWATCGFWDTTISELLRIPLPISWAGGVTVNVAFLAFVTRRSQDAFRIQEKHKSVMRDVGHAREIQLGLITHEFPQMGNIRIIGKYLPMEELGGDFYNVRKLDMNRSSIFISDVTGHGIASAFITAMMKISLESLPAETLDHPGKVLTHLNEALLDKIMDRFITGVYGIVDRSNLTFKFCSAGHHPPLLHYRAAQDDVVELETRGRLLGAFEDLEIREEFVQLSPGDRVLLVTDGTYEAFNQEGKMFGMERLKDIFHKQILSSLDPLFYEVLRFSRGSRQADDMAGILICVEPSASNRPGISDPAQSAGI